MLSFTSTDIILPYLPNTLEQDRFVGGFAHNGWSFEQVLGVGNNQGVLKREEGLVSNSVE